MGDERSELKPSDLIEIGSNGARIGMFLAVGIALAQSLAGGPDQRPAYQRDWDFARLVFTSMLCGALGGVMLVAAAAAVRQCDNRFARVLRATVRGILSVAYLGALAGAALMIGLKLYLTLR